MITSTSRFVTIQVNWDKLQGLDRIDCYLDDASNTYVAITLKNEFPESGSIDETNLHELQLIYVSDEGFQDSNGDPITPILFTEGFGHGTTVESLATFGQWNPLDPDGWERYEHRQKLLGLATRALLEVNEDTLAIIAHLLPTMFNPRSATYEYPMRYWFMSQSATNQFWMRLLVDRNDEISGPNTNTYPPVMALFAWLESLRVTGDPIGSSFVSDSTFENRIFSVDQLGASDTPLRFQYTTQENQTAEPSNFTELAIQFTIESDSAPIEPKDFRRLLLSATATLPSSDIQIPPNVGRKGVPYRTDIIQPTDDEFLKFANGGMYWRGVDHEGDPFEIEVTDGKSYPYRSFEPYNAGGVSGRILESRPFMDTIVMDSMETEDKRFYIPEPSSVIISEGTSKTWQLHNHNHDYNFDVWDLVDNTRLFTLKPTESCFIKLSLFKDVVSGNDRGEILVYDLSERELTHTIGSSYSETLGDGGNYDGGFGNILHEVSVNLTGATVTHDEDAFAMGVNALGNNTLLSNGIAGYSESVQVLQDGVVNARLSLEILLETGTGSIASWSGLRCYTQRGSDAPVLERNNRHREVSGNNRIEPYEIEYRGRHLAGDWITFAFRDRNSSIDFNELRPVTVNRGFILQPRVRRDR